MSQEKIVPLQSDSRGVFCAPGPVVAVYDSTGTGELVPVEFSQPEFDVSVFALRNAPAGQIYARIAGTNECAVRAAVQILQDACHAAAKHWWIDPKTGVEVRTNPLCFSNKIALAHSELSESLEGDRKNRMDDHLPHRSMREVELADALIRIFDTGGGFEMDLAGAVVEKMAYNARRADHKVENRVKADGKAY